MTVRSDSIRSHRTVVVTGGAYGIGRGIASAFVNQGARIVLVDRDAEGLEDAERALSAGSDLISVVADVARAEDMEHVRDVALHSFGSVDVVCANAGVTAEDVPVWELSHEEWRWVLDVNVGGVVNAVKTFIPDMLARDFGHFVVTSSMQGISTGRIGAYAASKHAAASLAESLYGDLRRRGSRVGVTCLCPSYTKNARVTHPERVHTFTARSLSELPAAEQANRAAVRAKLMKSGLEPEAVGQMVVDAVDNGEFWVVPMRSALPRVLRRAEEIVKGMPPSIADT